MYYYRRCRSLKLRTKNDVEKLYFKYRHTCNSHEIIVIGIMKLIFYQCEQLLISVKKTAFQLPPRSEIIIYYNTQRIIPRI